MNECVHVCMLRARENVIYQWWYNHVEVLQMSVLWIPEHWTEHIHQQLPGEWERMNAVDFWRANNKYIFPYMYVDEESHTLAKYSGQTYICTQHSSDCKR